MNDSDETKIFNRNSILSDAFKKKQPILTFISGEQVGRVIYLAEDRVTFGRSPESTILVEDNVVSRRHMEVAFDKKHRSYVVSDLGSSNGVFVNNEKIHSQTLEHGDKIIIGGIILGFSLVDDLDVKFHGEISRLINIDELTGLLVPRRFDEELSRIIAVSHRDKTPLSMLLMDMDGVKKINDTYGHQFGAYAISQTGKLIKEIVAEKGMASRFGGDEFMAFFLNSDLEQGLNWGEHIRTTVEQHSYEKDGTKIFPTISIGVAELDADDTREKLFKEADQALYRAKAAGRNCVSQ